MKVEMLSIFILTLLLKNQGIFFILLLYSHMFKNKIVINSRSLFERLWLLIVWIIVMDIVGTDLIDIILFLNWIIIREIVLYIK